MLEREDRIATHQTGHNSGVIHAGIYYAPGSLKAKLCVEGAAQLYRFCEEHGVPVERCGKLIVARDESELRRSTSSSAAAAPTACPGLRRLGAGELREIEPHCRGVAALHSPETGVVDFAAVARALADDVERRVTGCGIEGIARRRVCGTARRDQARFTVFCAGALGRPARGRAGADPDPRIVPFRGAYLLLKPERRELVRSLIYPVPDPSLPFLGVHLTRHIDGEVSLGPTALLAPRRGLGSTLAWPGSGAVPPLVAHRRHRDRATP